MHIKNIHCMVEKLAECAKCEVEKGIEQLNTEEMGEVTDMIKDLCEAEYYARIAKAMEKSEEDEKKEDEYFLKMLKEEYGEDEGEKRFYDNYRHANGRFARKGTGKYMPRRGYEEPPYYHMMPEDYKEHTPEYWRDVDRHMGKMYFTPMAGGDMGGNSGGGTREYSDGYDEGQRRGYSEGYEQGSRDGESRGRSQGGTSRYERAKRGYEETKEKHKGNTPEDKKLNMQEMEKVLNVFFDEVDEMLEDAAPEVKNMVKTKTMSRMQKIS